MKLSGILFFQFLMFSSTFTNAQDSLILRNKINLRIDLTLGKVEQSFAYDYTLHNSESSAQDVWKFWLLVTDEAVITNHKAPDGWRASSGRDEEMLILSWGSRGGKNIKPDSSLSGFSFTIDLAPGIVTYYSEGYAPPPSFESGMATGIIPGYSDLTPYGPGIIGKTIGPVPTPVPFVVLDFLDTIISYKHQALDLGWIDNQGIANNLDAKLDNAKKQLEKGNKNAAINQLEAFVNEVEAQKDKHLTSEAYALLK